MTSRARTIALYGGSFDPPHVAHQMGCLYALSCGPVDAVWLAPAYRHAFGKQLAPFDDRVAMCEIAARPLGGAVAVTRVEEEVARARGAESRTVHTLAHLIERHPDVRWRLLVGEDVLAERDEWLRWDDIVEMAPPIAIGRAGARAVAPRAVPGVDLAGLEARLPAVSSREVRARLARAAAPRAFCQPR